MARLSGATGALAELARATRAVPVRIEFAEPDGERLSTLVATALQAA